MVPFRVAPGDLPGRLDTWVKGVWLRPKDFSVAALQGRLARGYLPMWLVDAEATGAWQAQAGYDYEVASAKEHWQGSQWVTQHEKETRIRWEPRAGVLRRAYANAATPAVDDHAQLTAALGDFPFEAARPYDSTAAAEVTVRMPTLEAEGAWPFARTRLDERVTRDIQAAVGAQHTDQVKLELAYSNRHWTQLLLPIYTTAYQDDEGHWQPVIINGSTGQVSGVRRASQRVAWQWTGLMAAGAVGLFLLSLLFSAVGVLLPPVLVVGGLVLVLSIIAGLAAPIPAVWAWQFNRGQG
jgi:hypothetical protein